MRREREMAQRKITLLTDDLDGSKAIETVRFALDGQTLEIDLNQENAARLRDALGEYLPHARKAGSANRTVASRARSSTRTERHAGTNQDDPQAVRKWAMENGYRVSARGRIPKAIKDA